MSAYGLDIPQILGWTFPQLLLLNRRRKERERNERRFQLMLAAGSLAPKMFDSLWQGLGGEPIDLKAVETPENPTPATVSNKVGQQSHGVDTQGNIVAPTAPLLSDIALGKAAAPTLIPITKVEKDKNKDKENK